ncbi:hypothetical protein [Methanocalculus sp. MC3]
MEVKEKDIYLFLVVVGVTIILATFIIYAVDDYNWNKEMEDAKASPYSIGPSVSLIFLQPSLQIKPIAYGSICLLGGIVGYFWLLIKKKED